MSRWLQVAAIFLSMLLLSGPATADLGSVKFWPPGELLPERRPPSFECVKASAGTIRALLVGIDPVVAGGHEDQGSVNDANLMAGVLKRHQVAVTLALNATRAALVANLTSLAHDSRCGDTVIVFLASYLFRVAQSGLQFVMSDMSQDFVDKHMDYAALKQEDENSFPAFLIPGSPAQREGHRIPGALDSSELLDYFDRLRENGVNITFTPFSRSRSK